MKKTILSFLLAGAMFVPTVAVSAQETEETPELKGKFTYFEQEDNATINYLSKNGKWACSSTHASGDNNEGDFSASIYDLENGCKRIYLITDAQEQSSAKAVSEDGTFVVGSHRNSATYWTVEDGKPTVHKLPLGGVPSAAFSEATCLQIVKRTGYTEYIIGGYWYTQDNKGKALKWVKRGDAEFQLDGEFRYPEYTNYDEAIDGKNPDPDVKGDKEYAHVAKIVDISPDGTGFIVAIDWYFLPGASTYLVKETYNNETGETDTTTVPLDGRVMDGVQHYSTHIDNSASTFFSADGKYITGSIYVVESLKEGESMSREYITAFLYNVEEDKFDLLELGKGMGGMLASGIDNYGNVYISENEPWSSAGVSAPIRKPYIIKKNVGDQNPFTRLEYAVSEYEGIDYHELMQVTQNYIETPNENNGWGLSNICGVSDDGLTIVGCGDICVKALWMIQLSHNVVEYGTIVKNQVVFENSGLAAFYVNGAINMSEKVETVEVYNVSGSLVARENVQSDVMPIELRQGLYIVRMTCDGKVTTGKIMVR